MKQAHNRVTTNDAFRGRWLLPCWPCCITSYDLQRADMSVRRPLSDAAAAGLFRLARSYEAVAASVD